MSQANSENEGKKKAIIISVSQYEDLPPLGFCKNDGNEMYDVLLKQGYEIPENMKLVGEVDFLTLRDSILRFFKNDTIKPKDTLVFYFSGHGVTGPSGDTYLASSEINRNNPYRRGIPFDDLAKWRDSTVSNRVVTILDCCFSGADELASNSDEFTKMAAKGEEEAANIGRGAMDKKFQEGNGKCILASSLAAQSSYNMTDKPYSAFTNFLIEGLKGGKGKSVDKNGFVTPQTLSDYIFDQLDAHGYNKKQRPISKLQLSGNIILAQHPEFVKAQNNTGVAISKTGIWTEMKKSIKYALTVCKKESVLGPFEKLTIQKILYLGDMLLKIYENSPDSEKAKSKKFKILLNNLLKMNEKKLEQFCKDLYAHEKKISLNQNSLEYLFADPLEMQEKSFAPILESQIQEQPKTNQEPTITSVNPEIKKIKPILEIDEISNMKQIEEKLTIRHMDQKFTIKIIDERLFEEKPRLFWRVEPKIDSGVIENFSGAKGSYQIEKTLGFLMRIQDLEKLQDAKIYFDYKYPEGKITASIPIMIPNITGEGTFAEHDLVSIYLFDAMYLEKNQNRHGGKPPSPPTFSLIDENGNRQISITKPMTMSKPGFFVRKGTASEFLVERQKKFAKKNWKFLNVTYFYDGWTKEFRYNVSPSKKKRRMTRFFRR